MNKNWSDEAWEDYMYWQTQDKKTLKKVNEIIRDIERNGYKGIGQPEPLKHALSGYWSRRINEKDRIIYKITDDTIYILGYKNHYRQVM